MVSRAALTPQSVAFLQKLITHVEATGLDEVVRGCRVRTVLAVVIA